MAWILLAVIYLSFISLGLPDSLLGSGWPAMQAYYGVPAAYAGYLSMAISFLTILSALAAPALLRRVHTKWMVLASALMTAAGIWAFSLGVPFGVLFLFAIPVGLGAGCVDAALNNYVAKHYSAGVMNLLHASYGLGAAISPHIMALSLAGAGWAAGFRRTAYAQLAIALVCMLALPLWPGEREEEGEQAQGRPVSMLQALRLPGLWPTMVAFFAYCAGECTCFLWTSSYFASARQGVGEALAASFGSLTFGGLMLGRLLGAWASTRLGDRALIRLGLAVELLGILLVAWPSAHYAPAALGFLVLGVGMGPIYPAIQHMAPDHFGRENSAAAIGWQMAAAYVGSMCMPALFGHVQEWLGMGVLPAYVLVFALINFLFLELAYRKLAKKRAL